MGNGDCCASRQPFHWPLHLSPFHSPFVILLVLLLFVLLLLHPYPTLCPWHPPSCALTLPCPRPPPRVCRRWSSPPSWRLLRGGRCPTTTTTTTIDDNNRRRRRRSTTIDDDEDDDRRRRSTIVDRPPPPPPGPVDWGLYLASLLARVYPLLTLLPSFHITSSTPLPWVVSSCAPCPVQPYSTVPPRPIFLLCIFTHWYVLVR